MNIYCAGAGVGRFSRKPPWLAPYAIAVAAVLSLPSESVGAPVAPPFNGRAVTVQKSGVFFKVAVVKVTGGKPVKTVQIGLLKDVVQAWVAPSEKYIIWLGRAQPQDANTIRVSVNARSTTRSATPYKTLHNIAPERRVSTDLVAWSPQSDTALFVPASGGQGTSPFYIVHAPTATAAYVRTGSRSNSDAPDFLAGFWSRDGKSIVFISKPGIAGGEFRYFICRVNLQSGRITVGSPEKCPLEKVESTVGPSLVPAIRALRKVDRHALKDFINNASTISVSPSGTRTVILGPAIHPKDAYWAFARKQVLIVARYRKATTSIIDRRGEDDPYFTPVWSRNETAINFFTASDSSAWLETNIRTLTTRRFPLADLPVTPTQLLPTSGSSQ